MIRRYRHPSLGFALEVADDQEVLEGVPDVAAVVLDGSANPSSGFRANVTVTVEALAPEVEVEAYTEASLRAQDRLLAAHRLIDRAETELDGRPATRTLSHHVQLPQSLTVEQWRVLDGPRAYTATLSCATLDYPGVADGLAAVAESLRP